jgi:hypothetical protein
MRRPVSGRDAEYALKVIDVLEAQIKGDRQMEKVSTAAAQPGRKISAQKLRG